MAKSQGTWPIGYDVFGCCECDFSVESARQSCASASHGCFRTADSIGRCNTCKSSYLLPWMSAGSQHSCMQRASERRQRSSRSAIRLALGSRAHSHRPIALSVCVAHVTSGWRRPTTACCHRGRDECAAAGRMVRGSPTWVHPSIRFSETSIDTCLNSPTESCQIVSSTAVLKAAKTRISTPVCHLVVIAARVGRDSPALPACRASRCVRRRRAD